MRRLIVRWLGPFLDDRIRVLEGRLAYEETAVRVLRRGRDTQAALAVRWRSIAEAKAEEIQRLQERLDEELLRADGLLDDTEVSA